MPVRTAKGHRATAILLAGGQGTRMGPGTPDKIMAEAGGLPVIAYSIRAFLASGTVDRFMIVYRDNAQHEKLLPLCAEYADGVPVDWVRGGKERQDSVSNALAAQPAECQWVFIHDCARPLITAAAITALAKAVHHDHAAVLAHPPSDTIKRIPLGKDLRRVELEDLDRSRLWIMETPQAFALSVIRKAYGHVSRNGLRITDDAAAASLLGTQVTIVPNPSPNPKITRPEDLDLVEWQLKKRDRA